MYTVPMPPAPSSISSSYWPRSWPHTDAPVMGLAFRLFAQGAVDERHLAVDLVFRAGLGQVEIQRLGDRVAQELREAQPQVAGGGRQRRTGHTQGGRDWRERINVDLRSRKE